jgi:hypothetical protein
MTDEERELFKKLPSNYYVNVKKLWCGDIGVDIDHTGTGHPDNPLDYKKAINRMLKRLKEEST